MPPTLTTTDAPGLSGRDHSDLEHDAAAGRGSLRSGGSLVAAGAWAAAQVAAGTALLVQVLVLLVWASDPQSGSPASAAMRTGGWLWLLGHHVPVHVAGSTIAFAPLALTALVARLLVRAGRRLAERREAVGLAGVAAVAGAIGVPYAVLMAATAGLSSSTAVTVSPAWAGGIGLSAVLVAAAGAALRLRPVGPRADQRQSLRAGSVLGPVVPSLFGGAAAAAALLACGAVLAGTLLATNSSAAATAWRALAPGAPAASGALALQVAVVPNAAVFGAAAITGSGFAVGDGTTVTAARVDLGAVPAVPLLAVLPTDGPTPWPARLLLALPLLCGGLGAVVLRRGASRQAVPWRAALHAVSVGPVAGLLAAAAGALAGGAVGPGRLQAVGPSSWQLGLTVAVEVGLGAALAAGGYAWMRGRRDAQGAASSNEAASRTSRSSRP